MQSEGHRSSFYFGRCKTSATGTLQPAVGGLTAYRYMAAPIFQLYQFLVLYAICKISLYLKLLPLLQQRSFFDVPRNHQIIFIFPFFVWSPYIRQDRSLPVQQPCRRYNALYTKLLFELHYRALDVLYYQLKQMKDIISVLESSTYYGSRIKFVVQFWIHSS